MGATTGQASNDNDTHQSEPEVFSGPRFVIMVIVFLIMVMVLMMTWTMMMIVVLIVH